MAQSSYSEPLRRTQSATPTRQSTNASHSHSHTVRNSSPLRAPALMLINGSGEMCSMPSPIVGGVSDDDDSILGEDDSLARGNDVNALSVPSLFDSPVKSSNHRPRDYSPSFSPMNPPPSPPKRAVSPSKMSAGSAEGKPRPVWRLQRSPTDVEPSERTPPQAFIVASNLSPSTGTAPTTVALTSTRTNVVRNTCSSTVTIRAGASTYRP